MSNEQFNAWRRVKLRRAKDAAQRVAVVTIAEPSSLSDEELHAIHYSVEALGYTLYKIAGGGEKFGAKELLELSAQLGLHRLDKNRCASDDGVSRIEDDATGEQKHYIPYTNKPLNWHTDGYYNETEHRVKAFALHCVRAAQTGGHSLLLDHEMVYMALREHSEELVKALFRPDAMAIPVNALDGNNLRKEQVGPVFWRDAESGGLQMRFTARTRSIRWNDDKHVQDAVAFIKDMLQDSRYVTRYKLQPGEGVISNNCLHARESFDDSALSPGKGRLYLRARYFDRIQSRVS